MKYKENPVSILFAAIFAAIALAASVASVASSLSPDSEWQDVPPSTPLAEAVGTGARAVLSGYATTNYVNAAIAAIPPPDLAGYATTADLGDEAAQRRAADSLLAQMIDEKEGRLTFDDEPDEYSDNPVTSAGIYAAIAAIPPPDLSAYATTGYVNEAIAAVPASTNPPPDLAGYATTNYVDAAVAAAVSSPGAYTADASSGAADGVGIVGAVIPASLFADAGCEWVGEVRVVIAGTDSQTVSTPVYLQVCYDGGSDNDVFLARSLNTCLFSAAGEYAFEFAPFRIPAGRSVRCWFTVTPESTAYNGRRKALPVMYAATNAAYKVSNGTSWVTSRTPALSFASGAHGAAAAARGSANAAAISASGAYQSAEEAAQSATSAALASASAAMSATNAARSAEDAQDSLLGRKVDMLALFGWRDARSYPQTDPPASLSTTAKTYFPTNVHPWLLSMREFQSPLWVTNTSASASYWYKVFDEDGAQYSQRTLAPGEAEEWPEGDGLSPGMKVSAQSSAVKARFMWWCDDVTLGDILLPEDGE